MAHPARFERATSAFGGQRSIQLSYGCSGRSAGAHHRQAGRRRQWAANAGRADRRARANAPSSPWPSPPRRGGEGMLPGEGEREYSSAETRGDAPRWGGEGILHGGEERVLLPAPLTIVRCTGPGRWAENGGMRCATFQRVRCGGRGGAGAARTPRAACRAELHAADSRAAEGRARRAGGAWPRPALSRLVSPCLTLSRPICLGLSHFVSVYLTLSRFISVCLGLSHQKTPCSLSHRSPP